MKFNPSSQIHLICPDPRPMLNPVEGIDRIHRDANVANHKRRKCEA